MESLIDHCEKPASVADEELMLRYANGDMDAFDDLFQRHKQSVYAFIHQFLKQSDFSDDLFQEVFLRIIRHRERYRPTAKFSTWLFTIARSVCIDAIRKGGQANVISLFPDSESRDGISTIQSLTAHEKNPREATAQREIQTVVREIMRALPEKQREILLLREKTELTFEEIGRVLGCSANTAKSRMHYALLALRKGLQERGFHPNEEVGSR